MGDMDDDALRYSPLSSSHISTAGSTAMSNRDRQTMLASARSGLQTQDKLNVLPANDRTMSTGTNGSSNTNTNNTGDGGKGQGRLIVCSTPWHADMYALFYPPGTELSTGAPLPQTMAQDSTASGLSDLLDLAVASNDITRDMSSSVPPSSSGATSPTPSPRPGQGHSGDRQRDHTLYPPSLDTSSTPLSPTSSSEGIDNAPSVLTSPTNSTTSRLSKADGVGGLGGSIPTAPPKGNEGTWAVQGPVIITSLDVSVVGSEASPTDIVVVIGCSDGTTHAFNVITQRQIMLMLDPQVCHFTLSISLIPTAITLICLFNTSHCYMVKLPLLYIIIVPSCL